MGLDRDLFDLGAMCLHLPCTYVTHFEDEDEDKDDDEEVDCQERNRGLTHDT
jgi:hypothetical protein